MKITSMLYPTKLSFKIDGAIKIFQDKKKPKQSITNKPPKQKVLQGIMHTKDASKQNMGGQKNQTTE
jgi:hypothetical protein